MALVGTIVNGIAIILGSFIGLSWRNIPETMKNTVLQAMSLAVIIIGISMGLKSEQIVLVVFSLALGGICGELWNVEGRLESLGKWIEKKVGQNQKNEGKIALGFVTATLVYCIGAMSIVGAIDSGLRHDHGILYTKSILDGFTAIVFTSTLGIGVLFSFFPVVIYQGAIALLAAAITQYIPKDLLDFIITELTGTGGILILAIGLNILGVTKIKIGNLLPSLLFVITFVVMYYYIIGI